jgi:capsular polysaccharide biosynthesis protein
MCIKNDVNDDIKDFVEFLSHSLAIIVVVVILFMSVRNFFYFIVLHKKFIKQLSFGECLLWHQSAEFNSDQEMNLQLAVWLMMFLVI